MRAGIPTFRKIVKRMHRIYKHKEIAPIFNYLSQAELPGAQFLSSMKIRGFQRACSGIGTKGKFNQAMQTGFPFVTSIHPLGSLMPAEKR
jgi:hypothetical protein